MNSRLRQIEATLNQLSLPTEEAATPVPSCSFKIAASAVTAGSTSTGLLVPQNPSRVSPDLVEWTETSEAIASVSNTLSPQTVSPLEQVQPFPIETATRTLALPRSKPPVLSNHRHATNPALAIGLLKEIEEGVIRWQKELQQVTRQIKALYAEGPIVEGWLESQPAGSPSSDAIPLSQDDLNKLTSTVQELMHTAQTHLIPVESPRAGYRLCGLNADGQIWTRPVPAEQLPALSLAIARSHKLRQLLARKQSLENRLNQLSQSLVMVHSQLQENG